MSMERMMIEERRVVTSAAMSKERMTAEERCAAMSMERTTAEENC
jgi:hypothetical protein